MRDIGVLSMDEKWCRTLREVSNLVRKKKGNSAGTTLLNQMLMPCRVACIYVLGSSKSAIISNNIRIVIMSCVLLIVSTRIIKIYEKNAGYSTIR